MKPSSDGTGQVVDQLERVAIAGTLRLAVAALVGIGLWLGFLMGGLVKLQLFGDNPSDLVAAGAVLGSGMITALPAILSQFTRGRWVLEDLGIQETQTPLVSFLPFGLYRDRFIRWQDIESFGVRQMTLRQKGTERILHSFEAVIPGHPKIQIGRKEKKEDPQFDGFVATFSRRMGASSRPS
jgi:hypothetical protein